MDGFRWAPTTAGHITGKLREIGLVPMAIKTPLCQYATDHDGFSLFPAQYSLYRVSFLDQRGLFSIGDLVHTMPYVQLDPLLFVALGPSCLVASAISCHVISCHVVSHPICGVHK